MDKEHIQMQKPVKKYYKNTVIVVRCTLSNTILHVMTHKSLSFTISSGVSGFKGAKRSTTQAAQDSARFIGKKLRGLKLRKIILIFKGFTKTRKSVIKGFKKRRIIIEKIIDKTLISHNGCRLSKKKRK